MEKYELCQCHSELSPSSLNNELEGATDNIWERIQHTRTAPSLALLSSLFSCPELWSPCQLTEPSVLFQSQQHLGLNSAHALSAHQSSSQGQPAGKRLSLISQWGPNIPMALFLLRSSRLLLYLSTFWLRLSGKWLDTNITFYRHDTVDSLYSE